MNRLIALILSIGFCATSLAAQDIPLSKILVEKEGWRSKASGTKGSVAYLDATSEGRIDIYGPGKAVGKDAHSVRSSAGVSYYLGQPHLEAGASYIGVPHSVFAAIGNRIEGLRQLKAKGLETPECLTLWPDEGHLVVGESDRPFWPYVPQRDHSVAHIWAFRIEKDGSLGPGDRYYSLRTKPGEKMHVSAMTMDAGYLLYACTTLGIQVFDPTGRLSGVIAAPSKEPMTAITIGGASADELFVAAGEKIYARKIQGKASYTLKKNK